MDALRKLIGVLSRQKSSQASPPSRCPACGMVFSHASDAGGATRICNSCGEQFDAKSAACLEVYMAFHGDDAILAYYHRDVAGTLHEARDDPEPPPREAGHDPFRDRGGAT
jgi:hypothetical protein